MLPRYNEDLAELVKEIDAEARRLRRRLGVSNSGKVMKASGSLLFGQRVFITTSIHLKTFESTAERIYEGYVDAAVWHGGKWHYVNPHEARDAIEKLEAKMLALLDRV